MEDKKPSSSSSETGQDVAVKILFFCFILYAMVSVFKDERVIQEIQKKIFGIDPVTISEQTEGQNVSNEQVFEDVKDKLNLGKNVVTKKTTEVRQSVGGFVVGQQRGGEKGRVMEGPVIAFNTDWWRIDFKKAPDGWVSGDAVSHNTFLYGFINFWPKFLGSLRVILFIAGFVLLIIVIFVSRQLKQLKKISSDKKLLRKEGSMVYKPASVAEKEKILREQNSVQQISNVANLPQNNNSNISNTQNFQVQNSPKEDLGLPIPNLPIGDMPNLQFEKPKNNRWENILRLSQSYNQNDWRQAIIEADIILEEMLDKMGYDGETIGDKLKRAEPTDFLTLNKAWDAHKVRNQVAHRGSGYVLTKDETERVIDLYEQVFKEFYYI